MNFDMGLVELCRKIMLSKLNDNSRLTLSHLVGFTCMQYAERGTFVCHVFFV